MGVRSPYIWNLSILAYFPIIAVFDNSSFLKIDVAPTRVRSPGTFPSSQWLLRMTDLSTCKSINDYKPVDEVKTYDSKANRSFNAC